MRLHHIAIACRDIAQGLCDIEAVYGIARQGEIIADPEQNAELCLVETHGGMTLELVSGPPVTDYLKRGVSLYHLCHAVPYLPQAIDRLCASGAVLVAPPKPAVIFGGRKVAFLFTKLGLIELLEEETR